MNIACPECSTLYRIDPDRVPAGGVAASCRECATRFRVEAGFGPTAPGEFVTAPRVDGTPAGDAFDGEAERQEPVAAEPHEAVAPSEEEPDRPLVQETSELGEAEPEAEGEVEALVDGEVDGEAEDQDVAEDRGSAEDPGESGGATAPAFGPQDPDTRARRLARALISDIKVYHPEKWEEAMAEGTLRAEFRDEILKSWDEYVEQVGEQMAKKTPYFRDALNEILAQGEHVF